MLSRSNWLRAREDFRVANDRCRQVELSYGDDQFIGSRWPRFTDKLGDSDDDDVRIADALAGLQDQMPFDLVAGVFDFLNRLGLLNDLHPAEPASDAQDAVFVDNGDDAVMLDASFSVDPNTTPAPTRQHLDDNKEDPAHHRSVLDDALLPRDLLLLASVLPEEIQRRILTPDEIDSLRQGSSSDNVKVDLLNCLARLALQPVFTFLVVESFQPIHMDIVSRWLLVLGHDGRNFTQESAKVDSRKVLQALIAIARLLPSYPTLYP